MPDVLTGEEGGSTLAIIFSISSRSERVILDSNKASDEKVTAGVDVLGATCVEASATTSSSSSECSIPYRENIIEKKKIKRTIE